MDISRSKRFVKRLTIMGNCQAAGLGKFLRKSLSPEYDVKVIFNNPRTGRLWPREDIHSVLECSDIIIYQPLGETHFFNHDYIRSTYDAHFLAFPYIYNSGYAGIIERQSADGVSYFGQEALLPLFAEFDIDDILQIYQEGRIDFDIVNRFRTCIEGMQKREEVCELKVSPFIVEKHKEIPLFQSHNHPTTPVYLELTRQVLSHLSEDEDLCEEHLNWLGMSFYSVISPFDAEVMGYQYGYVENWYEVNSRIIQSLYMRSPTTVHCTTVFPTSSFKLFDQNLLTESPLEHATGLTMAFSNEYQKIITGPGARLNPGFFKRLIAEAQYRAESAYFLAKMHFDNSDYVASLGYIRIAIEADEFEPTYWHLLYRLSFALSLPDDREEIKERIVNLGKGVPDVRFLSELLLFFKSKPSPDSFDFDFYLTLVSESVVRLVNLATYLADIRAINHCRRALAVGEGIATSPPDLQAISRLYLEIGDPEGAERMRVKAIDGTAKTPASNS